MHLIAPLSSFIAVATASLASVRALKLILISEEVQQLPYQYFSGINILCRQAKGARR